MHPDNENTLQPGHGQLFLTDPATGETTPLGDTVPEITAPAPEYYDPAEHQTVRRINPAPTIAIDLAHGPAMSSMDRVVAYLAWLEERVHMGAADCVSWGKANRPKWLHIARTTKKKRTRKKYMQRLARGYVAALNAIHGQVAAGTLTPKEANRRLGLTTEETWL